MKREAAIVPVDWNFHHFGPFFYESSTQGCARVLAVGISVWRWQLKLAFLRMDWS